MKTMFKALDDGGILPAATLAAETQQVLPGPTYERLKTGFSWFTAKDWLDLANYCTASLQKLPTCLARASMKVQESVLIYLK